MRDRTGSRHRLCCFTRRRPAPKLKGRNGPGIGPAIRHEGIGPGIVFPLRCGSRMSRAGVLGRVRRPLSSPEAVTTAWPHSPTEVALRRLARAGMLTGADADATRCRVVVQPSSSRCHRTEERCRRRSHRAFRSLLCPGRPVGGGPEKAGRRQYGNAGRARARGGRSDRVSERASMRSTVADLAWSDALSGAIRGSVLAAFVVLARGGARAGKEFREPDRGGAQVLRNGQAEG
jgi:hypothetical protein